MTESDLKKAKLALEERRLLLDERCELGRLSIEKNRELRGRSIFHTHAGVLITSLVSVAALVASGLQFFASNRQADTQFAIAKLQEKSKQEAEDRSRTDEFKLKVVAIHSPKQD